MEEGPSDTRLLELVDLDLLGHQGKYGDVIWLIVSHTHGVSLLVLLASLYFLIIENVLHRELVGGESFLAVLLHLLSDLDQVEWLLLLFIIQVSVFDIFVLGGSWLLFLVLEQLVKVCKPLTKHILSLFQLANSDIETILLIFHFLQVLLDLFGIFNDLVDFLRVRVLHFSLTLDCQDASK